MKRLIVSLLLFLGPALDLMAAPELSAFKSSDEMVEGWYHRHEVESWVRRGGDRTVIADTLKRIAASRGARRDEDLVDTQIQYGPGNWVYEWVKAGDEALNDSSVHVQAEQRYQAALTYYTVASWPHLGRDEDKAALVKARAVYLKLAKAKSLQVEHVTFALADTTTSGFLHLPKGNGPFPVVIFTHGSDVTKEDGFEIFAEEFGPRGIAVLTVDLPGIGEAAHIPLNRGSDLVLSAARQYVDTLPMIDQKNVFVAGASFGGNAAARYFANGHPAAGVISMCGPLHRPFVAPPEVYDQLPALTIDGVKSRLGILNADSKALSEITPQLSIKKLLTTGERRDTPLLIFTTSDDPVAPLADLPLLEGKANDFDKIVLQQVGHCPPRWVRQPVVSRWIRQHVR